MSPEQNTARAARASQAREILVRGVKGTKIEMLIWALVSCATFAWFIYALSPVALIALLSQFGAMWHLSHVRKLLEGYIEIGDQLCTLESTLIEIANHYQQQQEAQ